MTCRSKKPTASSTGRSAADQMTILVSATSACNRRRSRMAAPMELDVLMQAHLSRVFGERDGSRRIIALTEIYAEDASLFEPDATAAGYEAISGAVEALYSRLP